MSDDLSQDQHTQSPGRIMHLTAYGDNADEIELSALDQAREFFGPDRRIEIVPDWQVTTIGPWSGDFATACGKKYEAGVRVRTVEASGQ